jgi:hypothetical protein
MMNGAIGRTNRDLAPRRDATDDVEHCGRRILAGRSSVTNSGSFKRPMRPWTRTMGVTLATLFSYVSRLYRTCCLRLQTLPPSSIVPADPGRTKTTEPLP